MFRWLALAVLLSAVSVSAHHRARARRASEIIPRRREGLLLIARLVVALPLLIIILFSIIMPRQMSWASFAAPSWTRWVGVALGVGAVPAVHWVLRALGRNVSETVLTKRGHELVTDGPYRWVRHPLYTVGIALLMAIGLILASWLILLFALVVVLLIRVVVIPLEERELVRTFGDGYHSYMARTGRLVPRVPI